MENIAKLEIIIFAILPNFPCFPSFNGPKIENWKLLDIINVDKAQATFIYIKNNIIVVTCSLISIY